MALLVQYRGTDFHGWESKPSERTVQGVLNDGVTQTCGAKTVVQGSSRTDAGAHARGQVVHFDTKHCFTAAK